jgi:conjugative transposon TraM protein
MQAPTTSAGSLARRKFYLALPFLCLPFLTFIYWILIAKHLSASAPSASTPEGLLTSLPDPALNDKPMDKLMYYQQAEQDSLSKAQQIKKDPYRQATMVPAPDGGLGGIQQLNQGELAAYQTGKSPRLPASEQEDHLRKKLKHLDQVLTSSPAPEFTSAPPPSLDSSTSAAQSASQLARFESMMADLDSQLPEQPQDPELDELNGMLDKILDIQRLDQASPVAADPGQASQPPATTPVRRQRPQAVGYFGATSPDSSLVEHTGQQPGANFFSLDLPDERMQADSGITAVVDHNQQLVTGSVVALRLTAPIYAGLVVIPENTLIYGQAALNGERLMIQINSIRYHNTLLAVALTAYDLDGLAGVYVPGALPRSIVKQSLGQDLQSYQSELPGFSLGAQAANAGIQLGKTILSRKTRLTQVTVREGHQLILMDKNSGSNLKISGHDLSQSNP